MERGTPVHPIFSPTRVYSARGDTVAIGCAARVLMSAWSFVPRFLRGVSWIGDNLW